MRCHLAVSAAAAAHRLVLSSQPPLLHLALLAGRRTIEMMHRQPRFVGLWPSSTFFRGAQTGSVYNWSIKLLIDWLSWGFTSHSTQIRHFGDTPLGQSLAWYWKIMHWLHYTRHSWPVLTDLLYNCTVVIRVNSIDIQNCFIVVTVAMAYEASAPSGIRVTCLSSILFTEKSPSLFAFVTIYSMIWSLA